MFCVLKEGQKSVYVEKIKLNAYSVCAVHVVRSILS